MKDNIKTLPISAYERQKLNDFLIGEFGEIKGSFLVENGEWWRRGDWESPSLLDTEVDRIIGYTHCIPVKVLIDKEPIQTVWWGDVYVNSNYRGKRLQSRMNEFVKKRGLVLGFPNDVGAKVYAREGWGVIRGIGDKLTLPFTLMADKRVRYNKRPIGKVARLASTVVSPILGMVRRQQFKSLRPQNVHVVDNPSAQFLSGIFMRHQKDTPLMTTFRDEDHVQWRLLDAPYEKTFYAAGDIQQPDFALVTRQLALRGLKTLRIVDYFGDIDNDELVRATVQMVMKEAAENQVDQIVLITTRPNISKVCKELGFYLREDVSFCWYTPDKDQHETINNTKWHWTIADYDFDIVE